MGCPKKPATPQAAYPEFEEVDLPDDDELDDLPEAGDEDEQEYKMKLTKRQILKIIREEAEGISVSRLFGAVSNIEDEDAAIEDPEIEDTAVEDAWAGGDNLVEPIDQSEASGGEAATTEQEVDEIVEKGMHSST